MNLIIFLHLRRDFMCKCHKVLFTQKKGPKMNELDGKFGLETLID
jgi:hypothetical protein